MPEPRPFDRTSPLRGRDLRHALLVALDDRREASIDELLADLTRAGFAVATAYPRKLVGDALRIELRRARVRRVGRGRYAIQPLATTTRRRIRRRWFDASA